MKSRNSIPKGLDDVIDHGEKATVGAKAIGEDVPLTLNTPAKIAADHYDLAGNPTTPLVPGKQASYVAQKAIVSAAYAAGRAEVKAARSFCQLAIDVLAPALGARWNAQWNAVGFTAPSLAVPREPVAMLIALREYFKSNPAREVAVLNITATEAQLRLEAVQSTTLAIAQARGALVHLKAARDESLARLRKRLSHLRAELEQVLPADDGRWYDFGFRRPSDGALPGPVKDVTAIQAIEGSDPESAFVLVKWQPSRLAESYRVTWKLKDSPPNSESTPSTSSITSENQALLQNLQMGEPLIIAVSARNRSGETSQAQVEITLEPVQRFAS
jgi:hypothetical protein